MPLTIFPSSTELAALTCPEFEDLTFLSERGLVWIEDLEAQQSLRHLGRFSRLLLAEQGGALRAPHPPGSFLAREARACLLDLRELRAWAVEGADDPADAQEHAIVAALAQLAVDLAAATDRMAEALPALVPEAPREAA